MNTRHTSLKQLASQRALLGFLQTQASLPLAELAAICGYDFLMLDCEHGFFTEQDVLQTIQVSQSSSAFVLVRILGHDTRAIGRLLDMGVDGVIVPDVSSVDQAKVLVRAMEYPPIGIRGFGAAAHRSTRYGLDTAEHLQSPRGGGALLIVIIESARGIENVQEILAVEGVDGALLGPSDLSGSLGGIGNFSDPAYIEALHRFECAASKKGRLFGTGPHPGHPLEALLARGHRLIILSTDMPLIREALTSQITRAKSLF